MRRNFTRRTLSVLTTILLPLIAVDALPGSDWPQFRGPGGQGHADDSVVPLEWSETKNRAWKVAIAGRGWSSPVVREGKIWLTTSLSEGRSLRVVAVDATSGAILHQPEVFTPKNPVNVHKTNTHASPTPVLEPGRVYVHFGSMGTACLDARTAAVLWRHSDTQVEHLTGPGASPVLVDDLLILTFDGTNQQFLLALEKDTGHVRWKRPRSAPMRESTDTHRSFSTPLLIEHAGKRQLISPGADQVHAYDPRTGDELWHVRYKGFSVVPRPVFGHGLVFLSTGFFDSAFLAIRPDGKGDVTESNVTWTFKRQVPTKPSPLLVGDHLYISSDAGIVTCLEARSGESLWRARLGAAISASPVHAGGRLYFPDEDGRVTVLQPGPKHEVLAVNQLDGSLWASPAVSDGAFFLRTETHLYRIEKQEG